MIDGASNDHKMACAQIATEWLKDEPLILDTETTGVGEDDEVIEVCLMSHTGDVLLSTLVRPSKSIPEEASKINGIYDNDILTSPTWNEVHADLSRLIAGKTVIMYGADFDVRLMEQTAREYDLPPLNFRPECAMVLFAEWNGERKGDGYRWMKLVWAANYFDINVEGAHRAEADCMMTLEVVKRMAQAA
jgi:DNA polymerase III subunit epsilon